VERSEATALLNPPSKFFLHPQEVLLSLTWTGSKEQIHTISSQPILLGLECLKLIHINSPYLFILPSQRVFVGKGCSLLSIVAPNNPCLGYYNEARILDQRTFATLVTLPNMPGNVNNFLAGRTYPMEGAAVMLPQTARK
jgi:hypothetical protein